jgi:hypothetical protein
LCTALQQPAENDNYGPSEDWVSAAILVRSIRGKGQRDSATNDLHVDHETEQGTTRVIEIYNMPAVSPHRPAERTGEAITTYKFANARLSACR